MKVFRIIICILTVSVSCSITSAPQDVRGCNPYGFFAEFLWVVNHIEWCLATNRTPTVYFGRNFAYHVSEGYNGSFNGWEYYFEPLSNYSYKPGDKLHAVTHYRRDNNFSTIWWYHQYIDNKNLCTLQEQRSFIAIDNHDELYRSKRYDSFRVTNYPIGKFHLYSVDFRQYVKKNFIDPFIKIKSVIQSKLDTFYATHMKDKKTIGLHLRGQHLFGEVIFVPLEHMFAHANKLAAGSNCQFFIATDQEPLIELARKHLNGNVIFYEFPRSQTTTSPYEGKKLPPQQGEAILIETMLLSLCDHLVHTLSNVSTTALYFNPQLEHTLLY